MARNGLHLWTTARQVVIVHDWWGRTHVPWFPSRSLSFTHRAAPRSLFVDLSVSTPSMRARTHHKSRCKPP